MTKMKLKKTNPYDYVGLLIQQLFVSIYYNKLQIINYSNF